ncbi:MAG: thiamine pyrophosphate-dependent dehydrogenase E1 component subunit alpha [Gammaproteobacteria bacterium]|nr:thiamine pyrophosphate-dependent dehydrogenase E1 component subunit alpha [Gammaproteobacteria bacterium]
MEKSKLLTAYRKMRTIRDFEERMHVEFATGGVPGFVHLYVGQEACAVGVCSQLEGNDTLLGTHRGHGHALAKGVDARRLLFEIFGRAEGLCGGNAGSCHVHDSSVRYIGANSGVGSGAAIACGVALAAKTRSDGAVAVPLIGEGAANQGVVLEAMNLASVWKLPVVFVFENNGYAEATGSDWAIAGGELWGRAAAFDMPGVAVEGHDFFAVSEAAAELIDRARKESRPAVLELRQKRFYGHFEGDAQTYRGDGEVDYLRSERDCLTIFTDRVIAEDWLTKEELAVIDEEVTTLIADIYEEVKEAALPAESRLFDNVYASPY